MKHIITTEQAGERLDKVLALVASASRAEVQKWVDAGMVLLDEKTAKKSSVKVKEGQSMTWEPAPSTAKEEAIEIEKEDPKGVNTFGIQVVAEENDYIVINKPMGLLVHPTDADESNTLARWITETYPEIAKVGEDVRRPGIMHRLDKDASGLMVIARTQKMYDHLKMQFQSRQVHKVYAVLVQGTIETDHDVITFEIDRGRDGKMAARPHIDTLKLKNIGKVQEGKEAITEFDVLERYANSTLLKVKIHTGRTHQIRVHMFAYAHPVVGDTIYQQKRDQYKEKMVRLFLHASELGFTDLSGGEQVYTSVLPKDLQAYLDSLN